MAKIVVLGGSGFLGKSLLKKLSKQKIRVRTMVHINDTNAKTEKFKGDILSEKILNKELSRGDIVVNLVGQDQNDILKFIDLNILGGLNLLNSAIKKKIDRVILISSINVYGENLSYPSKETDIPKPQSRYGIIKLVTEKTYEHYSKKHQLNITILRLANLYGPNKKSGYIASLIHSLRNNKENTAYNNGKQFQDLLYVEDAVDGIIESIKKPQSGFCVFNISSGKRYMINELIGMLESISNKKLKVRRVSEIPDERCIWANCSKAKKILQFTPRITIRKGLVLTLNQLLKQKRNS